MIIWKSFKRKLPLPGTNILVKSSKSGVFSIGIVQFNLHVRKIIFEQVRQSAINQDRAQIVFLSDDSNEDEDTEFDFNDFWIYPSELEGL